MILEHCSSAQFKSEVQSSERLVNNIMSGLGIGWLFSGTDPFRRLLQSRCRI